MLPKCFQTLFWFYTCPGKFTSARKTEHFIGLFITAVDRIKCRYAHSGMTSGVGGFQNPGVCPQAFPSFLPHPLPAYSRHFSRSLCSETARKRLLRRLHLRRIPNSVHAQSLFSPVALTSLSLVGIRQLFAPFASCGSIVDCFHHQGTTSQ